jgi:hypothetical protein
VVGSESGTIAGDVSTEEWKSDGEEFSVLLCGSSGIGDCAICVVWDGEGEKGGVGEDGKKAEEGREKKMG